MIISAFGFLIGWLQQNPTYIFKLVCFTKIRQEIMEDCMNGISGAIGWII